MAWAEGNATDALLSVQQLQMNIRAECGLQDRDITAILYSSKVMKLILSHFSIVPSRKNLHAALIDLRVGR